jgi:DNA topoisomerase I
LLRDQVTVRANGAVFDFVGKAGKRRRIAIADPQALAVLASLKRRRQDPRELLVFRGARGWTRIHREDVNNFLRAESGGPFSAKEYRTWNATVIAAATLAAWRPHALTCTSGRVAGGCDRARKHAYCCPLHRPEGA